MHTVLTQWVLVDIDPTICPQVFCLVTNVIFHTTYCENNIVQYKTLYLIADICTQRNLYRITTTTTTTKQIYFAQLFFSRQNCLLLLLQFAVKNGCVIYLILWEDFAGKLVAMDYIYLYVCIYVSVCVSVTDHGFVFSNTIQQINNL